MTVFGFLKRRERKAVTSRREVAEGTVSWWEILVKVIRYLRLEEWRRRVDGAPKKSACCSAVFSTGYPRRYSLAPAMLFCANRTRSERFIRYGRR